IFPQRDVAARERAAAAAPHPHEDADLVWDSRLRHQTLRKGRRLERPRRPSQAWFVSVPATTKNKSPLKRSSVNLLLQSRVSMHDGEGIASGCVCHSPRYVQVPSLVRQASSMASW